MNPYYLGPPENIITIIRRYERGIKKFEKQWEQQNYYQNDPILHANLLCHWQLRLDELKWIWLNLIDSYALCPFDAPFSTDPFASTFASPSSHQWTRSTMTLISSSTATSLFSLASLTPSSSSPPHHIRYRPHLRAWQHAHSHWCSTAPNRYTFSFMLKAYGVEGASKKGQVIHGHIVKCGLDLDLYMGNALIRLYAKCKCSSVQKTVEEIPRKDVN
ncbi:hypothetical protein Fmac_017900 [Flemingia macrophylla]|uniref:Uncharacterized protein n=1 Tax=Flemingia macrophylla TaxID=520843 RepID=A0ABD1M3E4_9FABA